MCSTALRAVQPERLSLTAISQGEGGGVAVFDGAGSYDTLVLSQKLVEYLSMVVCSSPFCDVKTHMDEIKKVYQIGSQFLWSLRARGRDIKG